MLVELEETFKFHVENGDALFSNYLIQDSLFERVDRGILTSMSRLVGVHLFGEIDELCSVPRVKIKCRYLRICDLLRDRHIKGITPSFIGEMQCTALELFNNAQIQRLQRIETLDHIENVIKNGDRTLQSAHWNDEHRICFTNSVLDLFQIIDPIIAELLSLPLYQYQIVHVEQLFASLIAHFVISLAPKSFVSDSEFVLFIGDLYKLRERAAAYLEHHDFTALKERASRSKRNVTSMKRGLRTSGVNESAHSELGCDTVFVFIDEIVNELVMKRGKMEWNRVRDAVKQLICDTDHDDDIGHDLSEDFRNMLFDPMYSALEEIGGKTPSFIGNAVFSEMNKAVIDGIIDIIKSQGNGLKFGVLVNVNHLVRNLPSEATFHGFESKVLTNCAQYQRCDRQIAHQFQVIAERNAKD